MCNFDVCPGAGSEIFFSKYTEQEMKFSIKDLVTFTEEILNAKLHFLRSDSCSETLLGIPESQFLVKLQTVHHSITKIELPYGYYVRILTQNTALDISRRAFLTNNLFIIIF